MANNVDNSEDPPTVLSFCSGYGGIELGLEKAIGPLRILAHVEIEAFACANLVAKMEEGRMAPAPIHTDIKTFPSRIFRGKVDILTGGYPCQGFSSAGKRLGSEDPRYLWPYFKIAIDIIRPRFCFFENVEGHISMGLPDVLQDLGSMGYRSTWGIFSAEEVGAPHQRKRVFILAHAPWVHGPGKERELWRRRGVCQSSEGRRDGEMANARLFGQKIGQEQAERPEQCGEEMANSESKSKSRLSVRAKKEYARAGNAYHWPARPGQPQFQWEEPRVVAKSTDGKSIESDKSSQMPTGNLQKTTQSELGGATDGAANRVDRLRLLGNGVVPQTAEKAWKTLYNEIIERT